MDQNIPWDAISAQLKNEATLIQKQQIQEWLDLSPENSVILSEIVNTWSVSKSSQEFYQPNLSENWEKLVKRINRAKARTLYVKWIAAAVLLGVVFLAGVGYHRFWPDSPTESYTQIIAPQGRKTQVILPDSTLVWLNSGAELKYPTTYSSENRNLQMKGECFFDVKKDARHPLLVRGSHFNIKVIGTRFNVNDQDAGKVLNVILVSGEIQVLNMDKRPIIKLTPGQQLSLKNGKAQVFPAQNIEAQTAWLNDMLVFEDQPFEEVISCLEKWYNVKINLDHGLYYKHNYTFKVKTESLREVLGLISVITPISYRIEGNQVTIYAKK